MMKRVWLIFAVLALAMILGPLLASCASPCVVSDEIVTVLATNETHVIFLRGHVELCPK